MDLSVASRALVLVQTFPKRELSNDVMSLPSVAYYHRLFLARPRLASPWGL
jgi:hypothetical protein